MGLFDFLGMSDDYTDSHPQLGFDQAKLDALLKKSPGVGRLTGQILAQGTYDKWTGQGFGSVYNTARDMATKLHNAGITRLEDFGQRQVIGDEFFNQGVPQYEYYNKATGQAIDSGYGTGPNTWGGTYRGDGSTAYHVAFNELGMPVFSAQYGGDTSDWGAVDMIATVASIIPSPVQPFAQAYKAVRAYEQGNTTGAIINALGSAYSFGQEYSTLDPKSVDYVNQMDAASDVASGSTSMVSNGANWLAQNAGNIRTAQQAVGVLNALSNRDLAGIIAGLTSLGPQIGVTVPAELVKPIQVAAIGSAMDRGDWAGASMIAGSLLRSPDLTLASKAAYLARAVESGNPVSMLNAAVDMQKTYGVVQAASLQEAARAAGLPMSAADAQRIIDSPDYKKDISLQNSVYKKAQETYAAENDGAQLPPEFFQQHNLADVVKAADDMYTTLPEAKSLWTKQLGYAPSEFDLMELQGLHASDVQSVIDNKSSTTFEEAETFLKDLYGDRYQPTQDEIISLMGLKENDAQKQAQQFVDMRKSTFDGGEYASQAEAQTAAIANGYSEYTWDGKSHTLLTPEQGEKLKSHVASGKDVGVNPTMLDPGAGATLEQQLAAAGNPEEYAYQQGDTIVVVSKRMDLPNPENLEDWAAFKKEKEELGGDNFQSWLTEKFTILEAAMKGAPPDSIAQTFASGAMWGYGKIASLAETWMRAGEAAGMDPNTAGLRVSRQIQNWSQKLVDQGIQNAESAVAANIAAVTKESIAAATGVTPAEVSDWQLYGAKGMALMRQMKDNPLGVGLVVAGEGAQEVPNLAIAGGLGKVFSLIAGKTVGFAAAMGTDMALNGGESFGGNYGEVKDYLMKRGVSEEKANAVAMQSGFEAMGVSMLTAYAGDRALVKAFMGDVAKDSFARVVVANSTKEWVLGNVEGYLQNASAQIGKYGEFKSQDEAMNAGIMEGLAQKGIAAGVLTADQLSNIIVGQDVDGNNVTYQDVITGKSTFDPATLDKSVTFGAGLSLGDAIGYHSTFMSDPDITPDEYFATVQAMHDLGVDNYTVDDIASVVSGEKEWSADQIKARVDSATLDPSEAAALLQDQGITDPTPEQIAQFVGVGNITQRRSDASRYADAQTTSEAEARLFFKANGITNPTQEQLAMFVGEKPDADQRAAINAYADPLTTTESEARAFFRDIGITDPTPDQLAQFVGSNPEADVISTITRDFGAPPADTTTGGQGADTTAGGSGTDTTAGGQGTDTTTGGAGTDTTAGGTGVDTTGGGQTTDTTTGGQGTDTTAGGTGADTSTGGAGTDTTGGQGTDTSAGGTGQDTTSGGTGLDTSTGGQDTDQITEQDIIEIVNGALTAHPGITEEQVQSIINDALASDDSVTADEVQNIVDSAVSSIPAGLTESAVQKIVNDAIAANPSLTEAQVSKIVNDAMTANPGITAADVASIVSNAVSAIPAGVTESAVQKIVSDALAANPSLTESQVQKLVSDAMAANPGITAAEVANIVGGAISSIPAGVTESQVQSIVDTALANNPSLTESQVQTIVNDALAANPGITATEVTNIVNNAVTAANTTTAGQISNLSEQTQAALNALTADQKALVQTLTQQGVDLNTAISTVQGQVESLATNVQQQYDTLTQNQKAIVDTLTQQGVDLSAAIATAQQQTQSQIAGLTADTQAKFDALTQNQKDLATQLTQQGVDINTAITQVQQQTQQQFTGLETRVNELMQQGQTYQQATQTAINELTNQNTQLASQIGTQGRTASQQDIDALTQMLGGQKPVDLKYDVTGDKQITQDDIDFLTRVISGTNPDWQAPIDSAWGPTGLYGQLATAEAQRQEDLRLQRLQDQQAEQLRLQKEQADAEAARAAKIGSILNQGQQTLQSIAGQLPGAAKAAETRIDPIYGGTMQDFDLGAPLDVGFFGPRGSNQAGQNKQQTTKIATGGYLDDLLDLLR